LPKAHHGVPGTRNPHHPCPRARAARAQVRGLCGRQLLVRALGAKVAARQHQLRRAFAAGGAPGAGGGGGGGGLHSHAVQLPQGDSWANTGILANPLAAQR